MTGDQTDIIAFLADPSSHGGGAAGLHRLIADNAAELADYGDLFGADTVAAYTAAVERAFTSAADPLVQ